MLRKDAEEFVVEFLVVTFPKPPPALHRVSLEELEEWLIMSKLGASLQELEQAGPPLLLSELQVFFEPLSAVPWPKPTFCVFYAWYTGGLKGFMPA